MLNLFQILTPGIVAPSLCSDCDKPSISGFNLMREIPLTQGKIALIDDEDYERVSKYKWHAMKTKTTYYACAHPKNKDNPIRMHRFILGLNSLDKTGVDHKNRNGLDNQKHNLRIATQAQNGYNKTPQKGGTSKYKGVSFCNTRNKWCAGIGLGNKRKHIGYFSSEIEAATAYDSKAKVLYGEFANLNFDGL